MALPGYAVSSGPAQVALDQDEAQVSCKVPPRAPVVTLSTLERMPLKAFATRVAQLDESDSSVTA